VDFQPIYVPVEQNTGEKGNFRVATQIIITSLL
jgi:hypothetical protein